MLKRKIRGFEFIFAHALVSQLNLQLFQACCLCQNQVCSGLVIQSRTLCKIGDISTALTFIICRFKGFCRRLAFAILTFKTCPSAVDFCRVLVNVGDKFSLVFCKIISNFSFIFYPFCAIPFAWLGKRRKCG